MKSIQELNNDVGILKTNFKVKSRKYTLKINGITFNW